MLPSAKVAEELCGGHGGIFPDPEASPLTPGGSVTVYGGLPLLLPRLKFGSLWILA